MRRISLAPLPSAQFLEHVERSFVLLVPDKGELIEWNNAYLHNHKTRIASDFQIVQKTFSREERILDIGSIPPALIACLKRDGYNVYGVDISPSRYQTVISELGLSVFACDIESATLPFEDCAFDGVIFNELFEHLRIDPIFTLSEVHRVMRFGGRMLLSTPNLRSYRGLWNLIIENRGFACERDIFSQYEKLRILGHMGHVREYTSKEVVEFLERIGFQVLEIIYRGKYRSFQERLVTALCPGLKPFITYVAMKNE